MRVLGRIRLSRLTEESTSATRQRDLIEQWATTNGHTVVGWAEDLDISGSVDPFDTPALGHWLTQEKADEWDILCAWKLDRLGRNSIKLNKLFGWTIDHHKTVVSCSEGIDLSTPVGRLIANVIAFLAEGELEAIRERTKASRRKLLESGRWPGGKVPYGFRKEPIPGGGYRLGKHQEEADILRAAIQQITDGVSVDAAAANNYLDKGTLWKTVNSKYLLGYATLEGETIRDSQGNPVLYADPILTLDEWDLLHGALDARKTGPMRTQDTSPLHGVAKCYDCGRNLYHKIYRRDYGQELYRYYYCNKCRFGSLQAVEVEAALEESFLDAVKDSTVLEKVFIPAENHQIELDEAVRAVDELTALLGTITSDTMRKRLTGQLEALDFRITTLEKLPSREATHEYKETAITFKNVWENSNQEERRQLLLRSGITYRIMQIAGTKAVKSQLYIPDEILDRLNAKNGAEVFRQQPH